MVMFRVDLVAWSQRIAPFRAPVLVVAISALVALLFTIATRPAHDVKPHAAGEANIHLMNEEHARVAELVRSLEDAAKAERLAAVRERRETQSVAVVDSKRDVAPVPAKAHVRAAATPMPKAAPRIEPPLQLAAADPASAPQPQASSRRPVAERARAVLATVQQVPGWLRNGVANLTDWAVTAPSKVISQMPERRFL